mmetsp:Transcript_33864/g.61140  ORF Transcript_33864/g.61140 Transcript_33864/m.61140 type:complete len:124 (+) Transcript_33864:1206-1577(+)
MMLVTITVVVGKLDSLRAKAAVGALPMGISSSHGTAECSFATQTKSSPPSIQFSTNVIDPKSSALNTDSLSATRFLNSNPPVNSVSSLRECIGGSNPALTRRSYLPVITTPETEMDISLLWLC